MYGRVWSCMVMYGHVWSYMVMYGHVWSFMIMYGRVRSWTMKYDHVWSDMVIYGSVWWCMVKYHHIWSFMVMYVPFKLHVSLYFWITSIICKVLVYMLFFLVLLSYLTISWTIYKNFLQAHYFICPSFSSGIPLILGVGDPSWNSTETNALLEK